MRRNVLESELRGGSVRRNMACAEPGASGPPNSWSTRETQRTLPVKLAQKGQENGQTSQNVQQRIFQVAKKVNKISQVAKKMSTKYFF